MNQQRGRSSDRSIWQRQGRCESSIPCEHMFDLAGKIQFREGAADEKRIVLVIFDQKNHAMLTHAAPWNSKFKLPKSISLCNLSLKTPQEPGV